MYRIGILGAGHFAAAHLQAIARHKERARAVCFARQSSGAEFAKAKEEDVAEVSVEELLESSEIDVVSICVPNHLHRRFAEAALLAGKHVFCEKPLALNVADADAVLRAAQSRGRKLLVGHLTRHIPAYVKVSEILGSGRLGTPRAGYVSRMHCGGGRSWRMDPEIGGGVIFDLLIHDLDLLNWYFGAPKSVVARGHRHEQGGYDYAAAIFTFENGVTAVAEGGFVFRPPAGLRSSLRIVCERGHIEVNTNDLAAPIRVFEEGVPEEAISVPMQDLLAEGLASEYQEFFDMIEAKPGGRLEPADARTAVACAAAIVQAADSGEEVAIER